MNENIKIIFLGMIIAIVLIAIGFSLAIFFIYYNQPEFMCELCSNPCDIDSFFIYP